MQEAAPEHCWKWAPNKTKQNKAVKNQEQKNLRTEFKA